MGRGRNLGLLGVRRPGPAAGPGVYVFSLVSRQWDRRVAAGFPIGQHPVPVFTGPATATAPAQEPTIDVYFSPGGGATEAVVRELGRARGRVRVQAYSFTSAPIAKAVVDAR